MPLHRYVTPTYFGGLPGTHDLINVTSGGVGASDGSALVAPQKPPPHPNQGTYFVAFGEDATSADANRGFRALAENTDFLDDIVHADQSIPTLSASVVVGAPVSSLVVTGDVFVGAAGALDDQRTRSGLIALTDGNGIPLHVFTGSVWEPVLVTKIHDGGGFSVLGTDYFVNPTVDVVPDIPAFGVYRTAHYVRGNLKTQPVGAYTRLANGVRGAEDLWAYAKTTRLGNVTFTGDKVFADPVTFASTTEFQDEADFLDEADFHSIVRFENASTVDVVARAVVDTPFFTLPEIPGTSVFYQMGEALALTGPDRYWRSYLGGRASQDNTFNARWDDGASQWFADDGGGSDDAVRFHNDYDSGIATIARRQSPPASWPNSSWDNGSSPDDQLFLWGWLGSGREIQEPNSDRPTFISTDASQFSTPDYDYVMDLGGSAAPEGILREYVAFERAGIETPGLSFVRNATWDLSSQEWERQTANKAAYKVTVGGADLFSFRRSKAQGPNDWFDDAWDVRGSLHGLQLSGWQFNATLNVSFNSIAVRPGNSTRDEIWLVSGSDVGSGTPGVVASYGSPAGQLTLTLFTNPDAPTAAYWAEADSKFYVLTDAPEILSSPDAPVGIGPWAVEAALPTTLNLIEVADDGSVVMANFQGAGDVYEGASIAGPFTQRDIRGGLGSGGFLQDIGFTHGRSGTKRWIAVMNVNPGDQGIYYSTDRVNWTAATLSGPPVDDAGASGFSTVAYNPDDDVLLAMGTTDQTDGRPCIAVSVDGGVNWARIDPSNFFAPGWAGFVGGIFPKATHYAAGKFLTWWTNAGFTTGNVTMASADGLVHEWVSGLPIGNLDDQALFGGYPHGAAMSDKVAATLAGDFTNGVQVLHCTLAGV
jgi:hypothetical protein